MKINDAEGKQVLRQGRSRIEHDPVPSFRKGWYQSIDAKETCKYKNRNQTRVIQTGRLPPYCSLIRT